MRAAVHPVEAEVSQQPERQRSEQVQRNVEQPVMIGQGVNRKSDKPGKEQFGGLITRAQRKVAYGLTPIDQGRVVTNLQVLPGKHGNEYRCCQQKYQLALIHRQPA